MRISIAELLGGIGAASNIQLSAPNRNLAERRDITTTQGGCQNAAQEFANLITDHARADNSSQVFLVWYSDTAHYANQITRPQPEPQIAKLTAWSTLFQNTLAFREVDSQVWLVTKDGFQHLSCEPICCPAGGHSPIRLEETEIRAHLVYRGYSTANSRAAYLRIPVATGVARLQAITAASEFQAEKNQLPALHWHQKAFATWLSNCEQVHRQQRLPAAELGRLVAGLADTVVRDAVLLSCLPDGLPTAQGLIAEFANPGRGAASRQARNLLAPLIQQTSAVAPNPSDLRNFIKVLQAAVGHSDEAGKVAPLTLLAFLAWWQGDGTRASHRVSEALAINPSYGLAQLLTQAFHQGVKPGWLQAKALESVPQAA